MLLTLVHKAIAFELVIGADTVDTEFSSFVFEPEILEFGKIFIPRFHYRDI